MNLIEKQKLRRLRKAFIEAPHYIKQTRWFTFTKALLDKLGDPGPEPEEPKDPEPKTFTAPEGCPTPKLADGANYCLTCENPVDEPLGQGGCVPPKRPEDNGGEGEVATAD